MSEEKKPYQQTKDKLKDVPFDSVKEMGLAEKEISMENWKRLTCYKDFSNQIMRDEFQEVYTEFTTGFLCGFSTEENLEKDQLGNNGILRVYKAEKGIQIKINENRSNDPKLVSSLASDLALAFGKLFYQLGGLKPSEEPEAQKVGSLKK